MFSEKHQFTNQDQTSASNAHSQQNAHIPRVSAAVKHLLTERRAFFHPKKSQQITTLTALIINNLRVLAKIGKRHESEHHTKKKIWLTGSSILGPTNFSKFISDKQ